MSYVQLTEEDVRRFLEPDESAAQLLARLQAEQLQTGLPFIDAHMTLRPGTLLEVVGPAGCGKTRLLLRVRAM
jgi:ABC-type transport system involved in cytochrome c biogenesis ATPase subunit